MINTNTIGTYETDEYDGSFIIDASYAESDVFFNLKSKSDNISEDQTRIQYGGVGPNLFYKHHNNDQVTYSAPPTTPNAFGSTGSSCDRNCGACVWSFLCKSATSNLASLGGGFVPKLN